jgi:uncharacterized protein YegL
MSGLVDEVIGGFNNFIEDQKKLPGDAKVTLVIFDDKYELIHNGVSLQDMPELNKDVYHARGMTALRDAVGRTIDDVGKRLNTTPEDERPERVLVVITTDGYENASRIYSQEKIQSMIKHQKDKYKWEFLFMAAGEEDILRGGTSTLGVNNFAVDQTLSYAHTKDATTHAFFSASVATKSYRTNGDASFFTSNNTSKEGE